MCYSPYNFACENMGHFKTKHNLNAKCVRITLCIVNTKRLSTIPAVDKEEEDSSSLPSQLPSPPHPTSPPPHPSLLHHPSTHSPSPPPSLTTHLTMAEHLSPPVQPPTRSHDVTQGSHDMGVDQEVASLGMQLDAWCLDLKRNVLVCIQPAPVIRCICHYEAS